MVLRLYGRPIDAAVAAEEVAGYTASVFLAIVFPVEVFVYCCLLFACWFVSLAFDECTEQRVEQGFVWMKTAPVG